MIFRLSWSFQNSWEMLILMIVLALYFSSIGIIWVREKPDISSSKLSAVILMINKTRDDCHFGMDHSGPTGLVMGHRQTGSLPFFTVSLHDGDLRFRGGFVMIDGDEMWFLYLGIIIMNFRDVIISLDMQGFRMWRWNGGLLGDVMRVVVFL